MGSASRSRFGFSRISLRARVALGVALPIALVLSSLSLVRYQRERQLLEEQIRLTALQLGEVIMSSLRHGMLTNDSEILVQTLGAVGRMEAVQQVQIVGLGGNVVADSRGEQGGTIRTLDDQGCVECHQSPPESRPRAARFSPSTGVLRVSMPIANESDCAGCHGQERPTLGVLLADLSMADTERLLQSNLRVDLAISVGSTVLVALGLYLLMHLFVVRRVESFRGPLDEFAAGDFSARLPVPSGPADELGELANTFNRMADELDRSAREREERSRLRQRAIIEERERIARELHDGLAQLLGYVNTKAMAVRMMLKNQRTEAADRNLRQLEEASRELFVDVREAILDLKMSGRGEADLAVALNDYIAQFCRLSGVPVELSLAPAVETLSLTAETKLQLLRIVQESLTNVRKHSAATNAWIGLQVLDGALELMVRDNGVGFDPGVIRAGHRPHFGLRTMQERAEATGAEFGLDSKPGDGTCVFVRLPLKDLS